MGVTVMTGVEVLRGYALRAAVRLVSKGLETVTPLSNVLHVLPAHRDKRREPTSGLEPLTPAHYECAVSGCWALHRIANPA